MEEFPQFQNRVELESGRTRFGTPRTKIHYTPHSGYDTAVRTNVARLQKILQKAGYTVLTDRAGSLTPRADHAVATCRMSQDPRKGVVDKNLRLHGVENVYICSNAVFPNVAAVNPTLTLTALSLRLGDHLLKGAS